MQSWRQWLEEQQRNPSFASFHTQLKQIYIATKEGGKQVLVAGERLDSPSSTLHTCFSHCYLLAGASVAMLPMLIGLSRKAIHCSTQLVSKKNVRRTALSPACQAQGGRWS